MRFPVRGWSLQCLASRCCLHCPGRIKCVSATMIGNECADLRRYDCILLIRVVLCGIPYVQCPQYQNPKTGTPRIACPPLIPIQNVHLCRLRVVTALVFEKTCLFGREVDSECDGCDAEAGEGALEAVEAGEGARVPPLLTVDA